MKILFGILSGVTCVMHCLAAPFINLDFESVDTNVINVLSPDPFGRMVRMSQVMPGWAFNGLTNDTMNLNDSGCYFNGCSTIITRGAVTNVGLSSFFPNGLHGNVGMGLAPFPNFSITLSQRGDVPPDAKYLYLDVQLSTFALFGIWIDGEQQHSYDISAFAGKNINLELRFGAFQQSPGPTMPPATVGLDAVVFLVPPKLETASSLGTNGFTLSWTNDVSTRYQVEYATNFPAKWQPSGAAVSSTNGTFTFTDTNATAKAASQRFYRLRLAP